MCVVEGGGGLGMGAIRGRPKGQPLSLRLWGPMALAPRCGDGRRACIYCMYRLTLLPLLKPCFISAAEGEGRPEKRDGKENKKNDGGICCGRKQHKKRVVTKCVNTI